MKQTKVIRVDEDFAAMFEQGRQALQLATGKRISVTRYSTELANVMRPFQSIGKENIYPREKRKT